MTKLHWTRRGLLLSSAAALGGLVTTGAWSQDQSSDGGTDVGSVAPLPPGMTDSGDDLNDFYTDRGALEPDIKQKRKAQSLADYVAAWKGTRKLRPFDVASFMIAVAQGQIKDGGKAPDGTRLSDVKDDDGKTLPIDTEWAGYTRAWPLNAAANPLIRDHFFTTTNLDPTGDETAWCSAYMNWCFQVAWARRSDAGSLPAGTHSAASSSWRTWKATENKITFARNSNVPKGGTPREGDIVVFADVDDDTHGHVALFKALEGSNIRFIGGNHLEGKPTKHVISEKVLPLWGKVLEIHSVHTNRHLET